jgi:hypothetical protein
MTTCYLRMGSDYLSESVRFPSIAKAKAEFFATARELWRYEQPIEASIHLGHTLDEIVEYPDYTLRLGPKGNLIKEAA